MEMVASARRRVLQPKVLLQDQVVVGGVHLLGLWQGMSVACDVNPPEIVWCEKRINGSRCEPFSNLFFYFLYFFRGEHYLHPTTCVHCAIDSSWFCTTLYEYSTR
jgi:hypothetical protein